VRVAYAYFPRPSVSDDTIPSRYADALVVYATWRSFNLSQAPEEVTRAQVLAAVWAEAKGRILQGADPAAFSDETRFAPMEAC